MKALVFFNKYYFYLKQYYFFNNLISLPGAINSFPVEFTFLFILIFIGVYFINFLTHPTPFFKLHFYFFYLLHLVLRQKSKYIHYMFNKIKNHFMKMKTALSFGYTAMSFREDGMSATKTGLSDLYFGTSLSKTAMSDSNYGLSVANYITYTPCYGNTDANYAYSITETGLSKRKTAYCVSYYAKPIFTKFGICNRKLFKTTSVNNYTNLIINNIIILNIMDFLCNTMENKGQKICPIIFSAQNIHLYENYFLTFKTLEL